MNMGNFPMDCRSARKRYLEAAERYARGWKRSTGAKQEHTLDEDEGRVHLLPGEDVRDETVGGEELAAG